MTEKRRCPNCGAYISKNDKKCYVCGEEILPVSKPRKPSENGFSPVSYEPEQDNDFVMPVDHDKADEIPYEDRKPDNDKDYAQPYNDKYDEDPFIDREVEPYFYDDEEYNTRRGGKRPLAIAGVIAGIVVILGIIVGICYAAGVFGPKNPEEEITVYFDKPSVNINIMDDNGVVYNWGADVSVCYKFDGKDQELSASPCRDHDNMWECAIPAGATDLYFCQTTGESIRTVNAQVVENENVYYVTDILLNSDDQLPMSFCKLADFNNLGVNAVVETKATTKPEVTTAPEEETEPETEEETEPETEEETEKPTEALSNPYNINLPSSWSSGATKSDTGNCVTYYEKYNYKNYGSGMLLSIYTFKAGDNSYGDLNAKKILTASDGSKVVIVTPTDIECDDSDEKAIEKYTNLQSQTKEVISSITVN